MELALYSLRFRHSFYDIAVYYFTVSKPATLAFGSA